MAERRTPLGGAPIEEKPGTALATQEPANTEVSRNIELPAEPDFDKLWTAETPKSKEVLPEKVKTDIDFGKPSEQASGYDSSDLSETGKDIHGRIIAASGSASGRTPLLTQALDHHMGMFSIADHLSEAVSQLQRQLPLTTADKTQNSKLYDHLHLAIQQASNHITQAGIEQVNKHFGVSYLDNERKTGLNNLRRNAGSTRRPGKGKVGYETLETGNYLIPGVGASANRSQPNALDLITKENGGKEQSIGARIEPNGAIGHTKIAADILAKVAGHLRDITSQGQAVNSSGPQVFDADGEIATRVQQHAVEYANTVDLAHLASHPNRKEPMGSALTSYVSETGNRLASDPQRLSEMGEESVAKNRATAIQEMFDRRKNAGNSLRAARDAAWSFQRRLANQAFARVFGKQIYANGEAIRTTLGNRALIRYDNHERARQLVEKGLLENPSLGGEQRTYSANTIRNYVGRTPAGSQAYAGVPEPGGGKKYLPSGTILDPRTNLVVGVQTGETERVNSGLDSAGYDGGLNEDGKALLSKAKDALDRAKRAGDTETAEELNKHLTAFAHHSAFAEEHRRPGSTVTVPESTNVSALLNRPTVAENKVEYDSARYAEKGYAPAFSTYDSEGNEQVHSLIPPSLEETVGRGAGRLTAQPGEATKTIDFKSLESEKSEKVTHPYYEAPVIDGGRVYEGKYDDQINEHKDNLVKLTSKLNSAETADSEKPLLEKERNERSEALQNLYATRRAATDRLTLSKKEGGLGLKKSLLEATNQEYISKFGNVSSMFNKNLQHSDSRPDTIRSIVARGHTNGANTALSNLRNTLLRTGDLTPSKEATVTITTIPGAKEDLESYPELQIPYPRHYLPGFARDIPRLGFTGPGIKQKNSLKSEVVSDPETMQMERRHKKGVINSRRRFRSVVGFDENNAVNRLPNTEILRTESGTPMDPKQARKSGRFVLFTDSLGRSFSHADTFKAEQVNTEEEYDKLAGQVGQQNQQETAAYQELATKLTQPMLRENEARASARNAEHDNLRAWAGTQKTDASGNPLWEMDEKGSHVLDEKGQKIPVPNWPQNLLPLLTSRLAFGPGASSSPLGEKNSQPLVSASGKTKLYPGVGVVATNETEPKGRTKGTGKKRKKSIKLDDEKEPNMPELNFRRFNLGSDTISSPSFAEEGMAPEESTTKLGRQFRDVEGRNVSEEELGKSGFGVE
jgi:hypothetical protein